jgi:hypothetical protein
MKLTKLPIPELAMISATRAMLGAGIAFLVSSTLTKSTRRTLGGALLGVGVLSTIPFAIDMFRRRSEDKASTGFEPADMPRTPARTGTREGALTH